MLMVKVGDDEWDEEVLDDVKLKYARDDWTHSLPGAQIMV